MILGEQTLREQLWQFIMTPDPEMVNGASIDLRVGTSLKYEMPGGKWQDFESFSDIRKPAPVLVSRGAFILVSTLEVVTMPLWCVGQVQMKSSRARDGWSHTTAGLVDPGWEGVLTMELKNMSEYRSLPIYPGLRMCQLVISMLDRQASVGYHGKYQGATTVEGAK